ncbi:hypothetical protein H1Q59_05605 [Holosporaceae bacterium 'Namur']|nr:hypothetical protein [Holosporaceae bacterium 'Namur']
MHNKPIKFIKTTMDGAVRLDQIATPAEFQGLYTDDLQTCIALIITGRKNDSFSRISLIHDGGYLSIRHILNEFDWVVGNNSEIILHLNIISNLAKTEEAQNGDDLEDRIKEITGLGQQYLGRSFQVGNDCSILETSTGSVWCDRNGKIGVTHLLENEIQEPPELVKRNTINYFNSFIASRYKAHDLKLDLQYDGIKFVEKLPSIDMSAGDILKLLNTVSRLPSIGDNENFYKAFKNSPRYPDYPQYLNYFKEHAAQEKIYPYTILNPSKDKYNFVKNKLQGIIINDELESNCTIMVYSEALGETELKFLDMERKEENFLNMDKIAKLTALNKNKLITVERTINDRFLLTYPLSQRGFVEGILNKNEKEGAVQGL